VPPSSVSSTIRIQAAAEKAVDDTESLALSLESIEREKAVAAELGRLRATAVQDKERADITLRYIKAQVCNECVCSSASV
jgi:hypothetical protein